ncbi:18423_t:CDS:2, partial [Dentiscutata erythropus]
MSSPTPYHSSNLSPSDAFTFLDLNQIFPPPPLNDVQGFVSQNNGIPFKSLRKRIFRENVREEAKRHGIYDVQLMRTLILLVWRKALLNTAPGQGPLASYFKGEAIHGSGAVNAGIFEANMYLAED